MIESICATAWIDGGGNTGTPCTCGCVFKLRNDRTIEAARVISGTTNNEAEYEGLLLALNLAIKFNVDDLHIFSDSQLIVNQFNGKFQARSDHLKHYLEEAKALSSKIDLVHLQWISRRDNKRADALCRSIRGFPIGTYWENPARPQRKPRERPGGPLKKKPNPFLEPSELDLGAWGKWAKNFPVEPSEPLSSQEILDLGY